MANGRSALVKPMKVMAILTFVAFAYALIRASLYLGETNTVGLGNLVQTILLYLIAFVLAILSAVYFWSYPGLRGIKAFSLLVILVYGYTMLSFPFKFGDTIEWTPAYLGFALAVFSLGLILAIWTIVYLKRLAK